MADPEPISAEPQTTASQPAPVVTSMESLDAAMAAARQSATQQQAEIDSGDTPGAQERTPAAGSPATDQPAAEAALEDGDEGQDAGADQAQPGRPSRMGRLREQLTQAEQAKREAEQRWQERAAADNLVRQKYAALIGTPEERQQLEAIIANAATPYAELNQARGRLAQMRQAQEELVPIYTAIEKDVFAAFTRGLEGLRTLDGMDEQAHQSLFKAPSGVEALKLMHGIGRKAAEEEYKGEIASLKAEVSALKTKLSATGPRPANGAGLAAGDTSTLAGLLGADGLPTEEAIARAKAGGLRHLGQPAAA